MKKFAWILSALLVAGCASSKATKPGKQVAPSQDMSPVSNLDPCATRLHDICGSFLLYYAVNHQMPQRIEQLQQMAGPNDTIEFVCPETQEPYIYNPKGLIIGNSRIVLYDASPTHNGVRWAVSINQPSGNAPLIAEVVGVPEARFAAASKAQAK